MFIEQTLSNNYCIYKLYASTQQLIFKIHFLILLGLVVYACYSGTLETKT